MRSLSSGILAVLALFAAAIPAHAAWYEAKSRHFIIYGDMEPVEIKAFGERLERFDQAVRKVRGMDDPPLTDAERLTIYAVDERGMARLTGTSGFLGFYVSSPAGSFAYVPSNRGYVFRRMEMSPETVFFHEYAHHLQLSSAAVALPAWVSEGFAEFFGTAEVMDDGSVRIGAPPQHREWSVQSGDALEIHEMLGGTLRKLSDRGYGMLYGRGWLLTHMLTFQQDRRGQLQRYVGDIHKGIPAAEAARAAFGDLRALDRDLGRYLRQSSFGTLVVDGAALTPGPVTLRPLRPGEAAAMHIHMKVRLDPDEGDARDLAADARQVAQRYPDDPFVQLTLAEAELAAKNYAAAEAAGQRALARDPKLFRAHIAVGRALMEQARESPGSANWTEVREWFLKANRLQPEHAEPLMLFYRSFAMANEAPTKNAVDGLLYALVLAPRVPSLRIDAVHQLVLDNRLEEARKAFAPIGFYPHSSREWRAKAEPIIESLERGDRKTALELLAEEQERRWSGEDDD